MSSELLSTAKTTLKVVVYIMAALFAVALLFAVLDNDNDNAERVPNEPTNVERTTDELTEIVNTPGIPSDLIEKVTDKLTGPVNHGYKRADVPPDVREKIKERAYDEHPHHITKRTVYIEAEIAAYEWLQTFSDPLITEEELRVFKSWVAEQYPDSFTQQNIALGMFKDRKHIENFNPPGIPPDVIEKMLEISYDRHPKNFSEQLYHLEEEAAAYEWLQNFSDPLITERERRSLKTSMAERYPNSFLTQKLTIEAGLAGKYIENFNPPGIPSDAIEKMLVGSYKQYPDPSDIIYQREYLEEEVASYEWLQNVSDPLVPKAKILYFKKVYGGPGINNSFFIQKTGVEAAIKNFKKDQQNKNQ